MNRLHVLLALALPIALAGCGALTGFDGGTTDDAGTQPDFSAAGDLSMVQLYLLEPGTYNVLDVTNINDGCQADPGSLKGLTRDITNDNAGNVGMNGFGTGTIAFNQGTLTLSNMQSVANCTYDLSRTTNITITADDTFTAEVTENQTNRLQTCVPAVGASCTSTFTLSLQKQ